MHLVALGPLGPPLAVAGQGHAEDDGVHAVEQVEPLAPLRPLAANVVDPEDHVLEGGWKVIQMDRGLSWASHLYVELDLYNTGGADSGVENVLNKVLNVIGV